MAKYNLTKLQVKMLLQDKPVVDGRGLHIRVGNNIKDILKKIDSENLYDKFNVVVDTKENFFDVVPKEGV